MPEAWIIDAMRSPRGKGKKNGALHEVHPQRILAQVLNALRDRHGFETSEVDDVIMGCGSGSGDHAMDIANATPLGLSASVQTTNVARVFEFVQQMQAGLLTVNLPSAGVEYQLPFGGTKDSSFGPKEQGPAALEFYSDYKTVYLKY